jgi:hypothetical protein
MRDVFLVFHYVDKSEALGLADTLAGRGLVPGGVLELWPAMRLLPPIDAALVEHRFALVLLTPDFLRLRFQARELDGLARRRRVVPLLYGVGEPEVARKSAELAVAALPGSPAERLVRLLRSSPEDTDAHGNGHG